MLGQTKQEDQRWHDDDPSTNTDQPTEYASNYAQKYVRYGQDHRFASLSVPRIVSTGQSDSRMTRSVTLPQKNRNNPLRPGVTKGENSHHREKFHHIFRKNDNTRCVLSGVFPYYSDGSTFAMVMVALLLM